MLGVYNYTVILTYIGMLTGFTGVTCAMQGNLKGSLIFLLIAGLCDMFDGKVASTKERTKKEKRFGVQIDSLSDLICFGVLPAVIVYSQSEWSFKLFPSAVFVLCALIRLAWFNVDEEERQDQEQGERSVYFGLPVTSTALIFPILLGLGSRVLQPVPLSGIATAVLLIIGACFLTPFRLNKPGLAGKVAMLLSGVLALVIVITMETGL